MKTKLIIIAFLSLINTLFFCQTKNIEQQFTYKNKPIHPKLVKELIPWISDEKPVTVAVDVAAAFQTNEYFADVIVEKEGYIKFQENDEIFWYEWLGKLDNGIHVVRTFDASVDGSGVFQDLLFIKFHTQEFDLNGKIYEQVIMTLVKSYGLGDRIYPQIDIFNDKVIINKLPNHEKEIIIKF